MFLRPDISRRPLRRLDCFHSLFQYCLKPLLAQGFEPYCATLVLSPVQKPINGFHFRSKRGDQFVIVFGRSIDTYFVHTKSGCTIRSVSFPTIDMFETGLAKHFKIKPFSPDKRPVQDWPPKSMRKI